MLSVILLSVIMLSVVAPPHDVALKYWTSVAVNFSDKHSSLVLYGMNYTKKVLYYSLLELPRFVETQGQMF
jgi:hypothetical protein